MQTETKDAIARTIAKQIIESHAEDIEYLSIAETTATEVEGVDIDTYDDLLGRVSNYIKVADVHVSFQYHKIDRETGKILTDEQVRAKYNDPFEPVPGF